MVRDNTLSALPKYVESLWDHYIRSNWDRFEREDLRERWVVSNVDIEV